METNKSLAAFDEAVSVIRKELEENPYPWDETRSVVMEKMFLRGLIMDSHTLTSSVMDMVLLYNLVNKKESK